MIKNQIRTASVFLLLCVLFLQNTALQALTPPKQTGYVAVASMDMMILPGTAEYLKSSIAEAHASGAKALIVTLDTPGGMLQTSQEMVQELLNAPLPVIVYVHPSGGAATSAGVFITLAAHIAAMAPGTSIGAAHPVAGDGKDIEGDMRTKAENMTIAMVRSISQERGRNVEWAEKSVKESSSITEQEALKLGVIDVVAEDIPDLLRKIAGKKVVVQREEVTLEDYSALPVKDFAMNVRDQAINVLANPSIAALLWLGATTGITLELYNPGAIIPGMVGAICLVLALLVTSVIPISQGGLVLLILGAVLIAMEVYIGSGILGVGGLVSLTLGALYFVDVDLAPGMSVSLEMLLPVIALMGLLFFYIAAEGRKALRAEPSTGNEGMIGDFGTAVENIVDGGRVFVNGEYWNAVRAPDQEGIIEKDARVQVVAVQDGLALVVKKV